MRAYLFLRAAGTRIWNLHAHSHSPATPLPRFSMLIWNHAWLHLAYSSRSLQFTRLGTPLPASARTLQGFMHYLGRISFAYPPLAACRLGGVRVARAPRNPAKHVNPAATAQSFLKHVIASTPLWDALDSRFHVKHNADSATC